MAWRPPVHDRSRELRAHLPVSGWCSAVQEILSSHALASVDCTPFDSGSDVVFGTREHVVKLTAPLWREEIGAEVACLEHVIGRLSVETPRVLASGELEGWPYVIMSRVPGVAAGELWSHWNADARLNFARDLGRVTRELHELDLTGFGQQSHWPEFWEECRRGVTQRHAKPGAPDHLLAEIDDFLAQVGCLNGGPHALLHTELLDQHILVEPDKSRVRILALVDFADGRVGPTEYEFAAPNEFLFRGEAGLNQAFLRAYGEDAGDLGQAREQRMLAWALCHRFGSLERMCRVIGHPGSHDLRDLARRLYRLSA